MDQILYALELGGGFGFALILRFSIKLYGFEFFEDPEEHPLLFTLLGIFFIPFMLLVMRVAGVPHFFAVVIGLFILALFLFWFAGKLASRPPKTTTDVKAQSKPEIEPEIIRLLRAYENKDGQLSPSQQLEYRQMTIAKLKWYGNDAVKPLLQLLTDRSNPLSKAAAYCAIEALEEIDPVALNLHILNHSKKADARRKAAHKLGDIGDQRSIRLLKKLLNDEDAGVRKIAQDNLAFYSAVSEV
jgi:hypothetical protein